jgi:hypothetical protein
MAKDQPQVTMIASYFASKVETPGVPEEHAAEAWREALYMARDMDAIDTFAESIATMAPDDQKFQKLCEDIQR